MMHRLQGIPDTLPCPGCGIDVPMNASRRTDYNRKGRRAFFHNRECSWIHRKKRTPRTDAPVMWNCSGCGVEFKLSPNARKFYRKGRRAFYHSRLCSSQFSQHKGPKKKNIAEEYVPCSFCGKDVLFTPTRKSFYRAGRRIFYCNTTCAGAGRSQAVRGNDYVLTPQEKKKRDYQRTYQREVRRPRDKEKREHATTT